MMPQPPPSAGRTRMRRLLRPFRIAVLFTAVMAFAPSTAARGGEPPLPPNDAVPDARTRPPPGPRDDPAVQVRPPGCALWTDSCVTCERQAAGRISCSNIGVACQPQAVKCVRSDQADDKRPDGDKPDREKKDN